MHQSRGKTKVPVRRRSQVPDDHPNTSFNAIDEACQPIPGSTKTYGSGSRPDLSVPMREIRQRPNPLGDGKFEDKPPVNVYATTGSYTNPSIIIDIYK